MRSANDPTQALTELSEFVLAVYVSFARAANQALGRSSTIDELESFMRERARAHPNIYELVLVCKMIEIALIFRDAEFLPWEQSSLSFDMYNLSKRLSVIALLTIAGSPKYTRLEVESSLLRLRASPAQRIVLREVMYRGRSARGVPRYRDRVTENMIGRLRSKTGTSVRSSSIPKVLRTMNDLSRIDASSLRDAAPRSEREHTDSLRAGRSWHGVGSAAAQPAPVELRVTPAFTDTMAVMRSTDLAGLKGVDAPVHAYDKQSRQWTVLSSDDFVDLSDRSIRLNPQLLCSPAIARERFGAFVADRYAGAPIAPADADSPQFSRKGDGARFVRLHNTTKESSALADFRWLRETVRDHGLAIATPRLGRERLFTKKRVIDKLLEWRKQEKAQATPSIPTSKARLERLKEDERLKLLMSVRAANQRLLPSDRRAFEQQSPVPEQAITSSWGRGPSNPVVEYDGRTFDLFSENLLF